MALIDRINERLENDLTTTELGALIDEASAAVVKRHGAAAADASDSEPFTALIEGEGGRSIYPLRAVSDDDDLEIEETIGTDETTLDSDDYRIWYGGRRIERLGTGTNPRSAWGDLVTITFNPVADQEARDEVIIKLVMLSMTYQGLVKGDRVGDTSTDLGSYQTERNLILASLDPPLMA